MPSSRSSLSAAWSNCDWATAQMFGASATGLVLAIRCAECLHAARVAGASARHVSRRKQAGSRVTVADSIARPADGLPVPTARPSAVRSDADGHADVLDAAPPALEPRPRRGVAAHALRPRGARPSRLVSERDQNFRLTDAIGGRVGPEGLERRRGPRRGRDGGGRGRADRDARSRPAGAGGARRARRLADRHARRSTARAPRPAPAAAARPQRAPRPSWIAEAIAHIGEVVARIGVALRGFFHPAAGRTIWWDQRHLPELARRVALDRGARPARAAGAGPRPVRRARGAGAADAARARSSTTTSRSTTCSSTSAGRSPGSSTSATWRTPRWCSTSRPRSSRSCAAGPTCSR